jgi:predicted outer membrane repeat protein
VKYRQGMPWDGNRSIITSGRNHRRARLEPVLLVLEDRRLLATFTVTSALDTLVGNNVNDPTTGTLRWAVEQADQAGGANGINFDPTVFDSPQTIALTAGELELSDNGGLTTIKGPTAGLTISGSGLGRVFQLDSGVGAMISDVTISDGSSSEGGGIYNSGYLTLNNCTISGNNSSDTGGGIFTALGGDLDVTNCTFTSNSSLNSGGAIEARGTTIVTSSTFTANSAGYDEGGGGAIDNDASSSQISVAVQDSIFMGDGTRDPYAGPEFYNTVTSLGNNVVSKIDGSTGWVSSDQTGTVAQPLNAQLGTMGNFGGPTQTIPLLPGSPALGVGAPADYSGTNNPITTDQRGEPLDSPDPDIGAFQSQGFTFTPVAGSTPQDTTVDDPFPNPLAVTVSTNVPSQVLVGAVVRFTVEPASGGASASLSALSATTGPNGVAQVSATANNITGSYTVVASAGEGPTADFSLQNSNGLIFSGIADKSIAYGTSSVTVSGTLAEGTQVPTGESLAIMLNGVTHMATIGASGHFATTFTNTAGLTVTDSPYAVSYNYAGDGTFSPTSTTSTLTVTQAVPTVSVADTGGTYDASPFPATGSVAGVSGVGGSSLEGVEVQFAYYSGTYTSADQLTGLTPLSIVPGDAGNFTVLASFAGSSDYTSASALTNFTIGQALPTVTLTDAGGTYSGAPFTGTSTVVGIDGTPGASLEGVGLSLTYYSGTFSSPSQLTDLTPLSAAPSEVGAYTTLASFAGSTDYTSASALVDFTITQATPTVSVAVASGTYTGTAFVPRDTVAGARGSGGSNLEGVSLVLSNYSGTYTSLSQLTGLTPLSAAPSTIGAYTVLASFAGSTDYTSASALADYAISQATPTVHVADAGGTYSGAAFPATDTVAGVGGSGASTLEGVGLSLAYYSGTHTSASQLSGLTPLSGAPSVVGSYTALASFAGSTDYTSASAVVDFSVGLAMPTLSVTDGGGVYSGSPFGATATVAGIAGSAGASLEGVSPSLTYYAGTYASPAELTGINPLPAAPSQAGSYTVAASFAGSTDYSSATDLANYTISQAMPHVTWGPLASIVYGTPLGPVQLNASASVPGTFVYSPAAGSYMDAGNGRTLSATFTPQDAVDYAAMTANTTITVLQATPALALSDPGGIYNGSAFPASVSITGSGESNSPAASLGGVRPTLNYYDGSNTSGTSLGGTAPAAVGTYTVVAAYAGSADYLAVRSAPVTFTIKAASATQGTATIALAVSSGPAVFGQAITLVATVGGQDSPSGTVTFLDGATVLATVPLDAAGTATLTTQFMALGSQAITASFSGDAGMTGAQSAATSISVAQSATSVVVVPHPVLKKKKLKSEILTADIDPTAPGGGVPTGTVTFELLTKKGKKTKTTVLGRAAVVGGDATMTFTPKRVLRQAITIIYSGDTDFKASVLTTPKLSKTGLL